MNRLLVVGSLVLTVLCVVTAMTYSTAGEPTGRVLADLNADRSLV